MKYVKKTKKISNKLHSLEFLFLTVPTKKKIAIIKNSFKKSVMKSEIIIPKNRIPISVSLFLNEKCFCVIFSKDSTKVLEKIAKYKTVFII